MSVCGQNITCTSYFSNPSSLKTGLTGMVFIKSWNFYLVNGLNKLYTNESLIYDKGVMFYLKFINTSVAIDSQPFKTVQDYKIEWNMGNFNLSELNQDSLSMGDLKYKFCVKVLTNKYIYQDQYSVIKSVLPGYYSIKAMFYNDDYNFYFVKEFNLTGIKFEFSVFI